MEITKKCPNCNEQVPNDSVFCVYCGVKMEGASVLESTVAEEPAVEKEVATYDGPRFCPVGHTVADPSLGFCPVCGMALVDEPVKVMLPVSPAPEVETSPKKVVRSCVNGHSYDDPELTFCPECGMKLETVAGEAMADREASVEHFRKEEPRSARVSPRSFPAGLRPATEEDLIRK